MTTKERYRKRMSDLAVGTGLAAGLAGGGYAAYEQAHARPPQQEVDRASAPSAELQDLAARIAKQHLELSQAAGSPQAAKDIVERAFRQEEGNKIHVQVLNGDGTDLRVQALLGDMLSEVRTPSGNVAFFRSRETGEVAAYRDAGRTPDGRILLDASRRAGTSLPADKADDISALYESAERFARGKSPAATLPSR